MNDCIQRGEKFLRECVFDGLAHSYDAMKGQHVKPYPEVTGYVIKYFCDYYEELPCNIIEAAEHLIKIQDKNGGYASFENNDALFAFDTSQILIGMCSMYEKTKDKRYLDAAIRGGNFLQSAQEKNGAFKPIYSRREKAWLINIKTYALWNGPYSGLMCKLTEGYEALYKCTGNTLYKELKDRTADFYQDAEYIECTHPLGYWLEGLLEAQRFEKVQQIIESKILKRITDNGYISYKEDLPYAYVSGVIQLGIILYKMNYIDEAKKILHYGRLVQEKHSSGGLFQYADREGNLDNHIHTEINCWGTKYFCELERLCEGKE